MKNENVRLLTQKLLRISWWPQHGAKSETPPGGGPRAQEAGPDPHHFLGPEVRLRELSNFIQLLIYFLEYLFLALLCPGKDLR